MKFIVEEVLRKVLKVTSGGGPDPTYDEET